jgi:hypothetical protein
MAATIKVFDGEAEVETAKVEVNAIGTGCIVTVTMVDPEGTALIAASEVMYDWKFDMDASTKVAGTLIEELRVRLEMTVTE